MRELITQVLDSGQISYGPMSREFETKFANLHGCTYAILSNSGTSALHVALQAMKEIHGWQDGDEIIVPATTFVATPNIVIHNRMKPVFVDIESLAYGLDPEGILEAWTPKTRAIIAVNLFGQACRLKEITEIASRLGMQVIEDSCETMFATHHKKPVGSWGDIGCFSTYVAHLLVTGVGGLSTTNNPDYAAKMRSLVNHGLQLEFLNPDANFSPQPMPGRRFQFDAVGHSFRITEFEAALGLAQLETWGNMIRTRRRNAAHLRAGLNNLVNRYHDNPLILPETLPENTHSWMMYPVILAPKKGILISKEPLLEYLNAAGIETRDMLPIIGQPSYAALDPFDYPISEWIRKSGFYVGCHQYLEPDDMQYVVEVFDDYFSGKPNFDGHHSATKENIATAGN
jgi:dTDP-4-amino-4,6-dideoxygalactose transaminase